MNNIKSWQERLHEDSGHIVQGDAMASEIKELRDALALMLQFAQALADNDNSGYCDFCDTGYCHDNHTPDCVITKAKEVLKGNE